MKGFFWFTAGAAAASYVFIRGKRMYAKYVPPALQREIARRGDDTAAELGSFTATFKAAMAEREAELRKELDLPEN